jgi:hypothetical protein
VVIIILALVETAVAGSPWVLPEDTTVLQLDFRSEFAGSEFLLDGENQDFPLNGEFSAQTLGMNLRRGFGKGLEVSLGLAYKAVSFNLDPVSIVGPVVDPATSEIVDGQLVPTFALNKQEEGLGDIFASVRYNIYKGPVVVTPELEVKIPGGYDAPKGTFEGDDPGLVPDPDREGAFVERRQGEVVVNDDVALGDGQVDLKLSLLLGTFIGKTRTFARLGGGVNFRFAGPAPQVVGDFKIGQLVGKHLIFYVATQGVFTLGEGEVIGKSFTTADPTESGSAFSIDKISIVDLRLDKEFVDFSGGGIFKSGPYELILSGGKILRGKNIAETTFVSFSTSYRY